MLGRTEHLPVSGHIALNEIEELPLLAVVERRFYLKHVAGDHPLHLLLFTAYLLDCGIDYLLIGILITQKRYQFFSFRVYLLPAPVNFRAKWHRLAFHRS
jgi:hypothetical protein